MALVDPNVPLTVDHGKDPRSISGHPANQIPYRMQQVVISWTFILASIFLELDFLSFQNLQGALKSGQAPSYFASLCNWFGVLQGWLWLQGFTFLAHWLHSLSATSGALLGCYLKLAASVFFCLQPMTGVAGTRLGAGLWWSNLVGILLFHSGNCVSVFDFAMNTPPGADKQRGWLYHGNLPITGMWIYWLATWILVGSNLLACQWHGDAKAAWQDGNSAIVQILMYSGAFFLLLGSVVYAIWCNGLSNFSHNPIP